MEEYFQPKKEIHSSSAKRFTPHAGPCTYKVTRDAPKQWASDLGIQKSKKREMKTYKKRKRGTRMPPINAGDVAKMTLTNTNEHRHDSYRLVFQKIWIE